MDEGEVDADEEETVAAAAAAAGDREAAAAAAGEIEGAATDGWMGSSGDGSCCAFAVTSLSGTEAGYSVPCIPRPSPRPIPDPSPSPSPLKSVARRDVDVDES